MKRIGSLYLFLLTAFAASAQNTRLKDNNEIGWLTAIASVKLHDKWSVQGEFQWRRVHYLADRQQNLARFGINYNLNKQVQFRVGYCLAETGVYGDYPLNVYGKDFTEHRAFEMVTLSNQVGRVELSHRFILEQRWLGRYSSPLLDKEDDFVYANRLRYMFRVQVPFAKVLPAEKTAYVALYDELLTGFGKNVNENVFDQNRTAAVIGYKFSNKYRVEAGFISQIVQLGREVGGRNVFQYNKGFLLTNYFSF